MENSKTVKKTGFFSSWNWKKIRKVFGHIGLLLAVTLYTAMGALVGLFKINFVFNNYRASMIDEKKKKTKTMFPP